MQRDLQAAMLGPHLILPPSLKFLIIEWQKLHAHWLWSNFWLFFRVTMGDRSWSSRLGFFRFWVKLKVKHRIKEMVADSFKYMHLTLLISYHIILIFKSYNLNKVSLLQYISYLIAIIINLSFLPVKR